MDLLYRSYDIVSNQGVNEFDHEELKMVRYHLSRIQDTFVSCLKASQEQHNKDAHEINVLKQTIAETKQAAEMAQDELKSIKYLYEEKNKQAEQVIYQAKKVMEKYEEENKTLREELERLKSELAKKKDLEKELIEAKNTSALLKDLLKKK